ncbi:MAG: hypothetical protein DLM50_00415 [Candidatus Meridianibacter frigidus]|nr:MAG: hypothetical protein DLM50_00415 [Candidatus Eremiobacteraeota bacterium]
MRSNRQILRPTRLTRILAVAVLGCALGACVQRVDVNAPSVRGIGYVRLDDVVKKHPLYSELSQIESNMAALSLQSLGPAVPKTGAEISRETIQLNRELDAARDRANHILQQKQVDYAQKEQAAVRAAIVASGENPGAAPGQEMQNTAAAQVAQISASANRDFAAYQETLMLQDRAATQNVAGALEQRADRQYHQRLDALNARESQASLEMVSRDSAQRLALRTKLNNLALDDALRAQTKAQLAALDRKEADAVNAMRAADAAELATYQRQLRAQTSAEIAVQTSKIHAQTAAKLAQRRSSVSSQASAQIGGLAPAAPASAHMSAATQAKIAQIDREYRTRFKADVSKTVADFNRTRTDLDARFSELRGVDTASRGSVGKQLGALRDQHDKLYNQIVAQVQHEVQNLANQRGLKVVFINIVAPSGGVDLTEDAQKDIESLHE